jgi:hypothetical protein
VYKYWAKTGDDEFVHHIRAAIEQALGAINLTFDKGLTWAKPDYRIRSHLCRIRMDGTR